MAQKYLMALDYVDAQANNIMKKHAKAEDENVLNENQDELENVFSFHPKRPLGDIETKHRYTPTQPVLSCRTVDIDVSGTRTYRPKSSADIINEQHALIHKIYSKARNISSAPPRRSKTPRNNSKQSDNRNTNKENKLKSVEVQGRPLTSLSQRPPTTSSGRTSKTSNKRPKTTGGIKPQEPLRDSFMIVRADREIIETRRSYRSLTDKIHKQWKPENHDLNTGTFQRGKKPPGVPSVDSWLTFNGAQGDESQGLVDAFADLDRQGEYYNIESSVGSRIAQQLQQGDSIRIGINGNVQTLQDLKVKKWVKEDSYVTTDRLESTDTGPVENMAKKEDVVIPLSWNDQLQSTQAKILTPREPPTEKASINLSETHPVVFHKLLPDEIHSQISLSVMGKKDGYRVKQRKKNKPGVDGKEKENKVTVLTIDSKSEEEEKRIENLTVEEVLKQSVHKAEKTNGFHEEGEKHSVTFSLSEPDGPVYHDSAFIQSRVSGTDSVSSTGSDHKHLKIKPTQPTFSTKYQEVDLDIIGTLSVPNGTRPLSSEEDQSHLFTSRSQLQSRSQIIRGSSARSRSSLKSAKSGQSKLGSGSLGNIGSYKQNEAEFIQISHPMKTPNPTTPKKSVEFTNQGMPTDMRSQRVSSGVREPVPSPELNPEEVETQDPPPTPSVQFTQFHKTQAQALSINIPTADYTDSALNSPSHKQIPEPTSSPQMRRAKDMRDEQIDQITNLLVDAIIGQDGSSSAKS